jgi:hypothetical protein
MSAKLRGKYEKLLVESITRKEEAAPRMNFSDIHKSLPYEESTKSMRPILHLGQRKLFLCELRLMSTLHPWDDNTWFVYAGSAPGVHIPYLYKLFPSLRMFLIDPNKFILRSLPDKKIRLRFINDHKEFINLSTKGGPNCIVYNDIFTDEVANTVKESGKRIIFISDIRTKTENLQFPSDQDILWNNSLQYNWIQIMKPNTCMLKFRYVYFTDIDKPLNTEIEFMKYYKERKMYYFDGEIWTQAFAGFSSSECRLVFSKTDDDKEPYKMKVYDEPDKFSARYFYYNLIDRPYVCHINDNASAVIGFDNCGDCAIENATWELYQSRVKRNTNITDEVRNLGIFLHQPLLQGPHGYLTSNLNEDNVLYFLQQEYPEYRKIRHSTIARVQDAYNDAQILKRWKKEPGPFPVPPAFITEYNEKEVTDNGTLP